jgi:hypothetical protein
LQIQHFRKVIMAASHRWMRGMTAVIAVIAIVSGCNSRALDKVVVSGEVKFKGQPVSIGKITFDPIEGTDGPISGAAIKDGRYTADGKGGVPVGHHKVIIEGFRPPTDENGKVDSELGRAQYLPAKFNIASELTIEVKSDESPAVRDFNLDG